MDTKEFIQDVINNELTGSFANCSQDNIDKLVDVLNRHHEHQVKSNIVLGDVIETPLQWIRANKNMPSGSSTCYYVPNIKITQAAQWIGEYIKKYYSR